jgi:hypothetical protein
MKKNKPLLYYFYLNVNYIISITRYLKMAESTDFDLSSFEDELQSLADDLLSGKKPMEEIQEIITKLPEVQAERLYRLLNPFGRTIQGSQRHAVFSIMNCRESFYESFITTALIAFVYRMSDEWVSGQQKDDNDELDALKRDKIMPRKTEPIDMSVRSAEQLKQEEAERQARRKAETHIADVRIAKLLGEPLSAADADLVPDDPDCKTPTLNSLPIDVRAKVRKEVLDQFLNTFFHYNPDLHVRTAKSALSKKKDPDVAAAHDTPIAPEVAMALEHIPPRDTFHRFRRYYENHYESLKTVTTRIYCHKEDLDLAVNVFDIFPTYDEAEEFKTRHERGLVTDLINAPTSSWTLLGPYQNNRERIDYYSRNTEVLKQMAKQKEADSRIGADLMKHRIITEKKKNEKRDGQDAEGIKQYQQTQGTLSQMGAEHVTKETVKMTKVEEEEDDCPKHAVEVGVITIKDGGNDVTTTKFFTQAFDPEGRPVQPDRD